MKELAKTNHTLVETTLSPSEVADSILLVFKNSIKQAGSYSEREYQAMYAKTENQLKSYLSHLVELTS